MDDAPGLEGVKGVAAGTLVLRDAQGGEHRVTITPPDGLTIDGIAVRVQPAADGSLHVQGAHSCLAWAVVAGETVWVFLDGQVYTFEAPRPGPRRRPAGLHTALTAPMPATVRSVSVAPGDAVHHGDVLMVLEAMKMELPVRASADGVVAAVNCREGEMVQAGQELIEME